MGAADGRNVRLNTDTSFLKLIAMITMTIDHMGVAMFPQMGWMRIVGRIAFPIYAYCIAAGCVFTKNPLKYALRIFALALISQPIYCLALNHVTVQMRAALENYSRLKGAVLWYMESFSHPNILFTLLMGILLIWSLREKKYIAAGVITLVVLYFSNYLNYGWRGVLLMVLFYALIEYPAASFCWVCAFMLWWGFSIGQSYELFGMRFSSQTYAVLALPFIYLPTKTNIKIPKWISYVFYPAHLAVIYYLAQIM